MPSPDLESFVVLLGCSPSSLLGWLKGLGLMAVTGQRGCWQSDRFYLEVPSTTDVVDTFLQHYQPKPIASPWNQASGFLKPGGIAPYLDTAADRWQEVATTFQRIQARLAIKDLAQPSRQLKLSLYPWLRRTVRVRSLQQWLAAVLLIREVQGQPQAELNPLLGAGGTVTNIDLAATYLRCCQRLWDLQTGDPTPQAGCFALAAIAHMPLEQSLLPSGILAHLFPVADSWGELHNGARGNDYPAPGTSSQLANPVDFILAVEGLLHFSGSLVEWQDGEVAGWSIAVYPLLLAMNAGSAETRDCTRLSKSEVWLPLWSCPMEIATFQQTVLADLRFRLAHHVHDTLDALQQLANRSAGWPLDRFVRFGFWPRKGKGDYAIYLGLVAPSGVDIGAELNAWRQAVQPQRRQSPGLYQLLLTLEQALVALAQGTASLQTLLMLLGRVEQALSRQAASAYPPQPLLSEAWVRQAYAQHPSPEFRLAAALASTGLRRYLSKARYHSAQREWVWSPEACPIRAASLTVLADDLLHRWSMEAQPRAQARHLHASLGDIQAFIEGAVDEARLVELAIGLSLCRLPTSLGDEAAGVTILPAAYHLAARLQWGTPTRLSQAAIHGLRQGSTRPLQTQARQQQLTSRLPTRIAQGSRIATALVFPVRFV